MFHIGGYWRGENDIVRQVMLSLRGAGATVHEYNTDSHRDALDWGGHGYDRGTSGPVWLRWEAVRPELAAFGPDLVVCTAGGLSFRPEASARLRRRTALVGIALSDPDVYEPTTRHIAANFDLFLTNYPGLVPMYRASGANAAPMPYGTNPEYFRPVAPRSEYECDIVVFGAAHRDRVEPVRALTERFNLHLYGDGWEPHGLASRGSLEGVNLLSALNSARLTLVTHTTRRNTPVVKIVLLDFIAAGALVVTNRFTPTKDYLTFDKEIIGFGSVPELIERVQYYLNHPADAAAIRQAGRARVLRDYDWRALWPGILDRVAAARGYRAPGSR